MIGKKQLLHSLGGRTISGLLKDIVRLITGSIKYCSPALLRETTMSAGIDLVLFYISRILVINDIKLIFVLTQRKDCQRGRFRRHSDLWRDSTAAVAGSEGAGGAVPGGQSQGLTFTATNTGALGGSRGARKSVSRHGQYWYSDHQSASGWHLQNGRLQ